MDNVIFMAYPDHKRLIEYDNTRTDWLSKEQACLRSSPLTKWDGFEIHFNPKGKIALLGIVSEDYHKFIKTTHGTKIKAMRKRNKRVNIK